MNINKTLDHDQINYEKIQKKNFLTSSSFETRD